MTTVFVSAAIATALPRWKDFRSASKRYSANPERKVTDIPGIGKGLAFVLVDIAARGTCERRDELLKRFPAGALEFLKIQGLGPKSIALLFEHFGVGTIDELEQLCKDQKLRTLPRMGAKLEEKVLRSIAQYRERTGRFLLSFADTTARELTTYLVSVEGIDAVTPAGSLRRGRETVGDLDLLVTGSNPEAALERIATHPKVQEILGRGQNKTSVKLGREALQVDVRALDRESFGAAMQYFTGSKEHNVALRQRAIRMGFKLSEYGLFRALTTRRGWRAIPKRASMARWASTGFRRSCVRTTAKSNWPRRTGCRSWSTGATSAAICTCIRRRPTAAPPSKRWRRAARALGYEYIAVTDHSKAMAMTFGLDEQRVVDFARTVRRINESGNLGIRIFSGLECDILKDGALDLAGDALAELDLVIGSVHSHMGLESEAMTDRLLRALESPWLTAIGHPTGRLLLHRDPFPFDFERVAAEAVRRGVWLEVNASPERLDLNAGHIRIAKAMGAKFIVSTDAHHPKHLDNMRYGIVTARRGGLAADDIMNTYSAERFAAALRKK